ncbi:ATP-binding protein [Streptomyces sp. NPDC049577]|uniref:ATP-binding protein n=1 Tax=Streptomyces sp. NPDC049577 TaxID=3155153 RepID=UPI003412D586
MSLPLTRRIARVALLVAAGAAPVVGAAGSASAADLVKAPDLGGLSAVDSTQAVHTLDSTAQQAGGVTEVGQKAVNSAVPTTTNAVAKATKSQAPAAQKVTGQLSGGAGQALGQTAKDLHVPVPGELPVKSPLG